MKPVPSDTREWTILVYMDGDNNLESYALSDLKELEKGLAELPDGKVDIVVLLDRTKGYDDSMGDWTTTRLFRVKKSMSSDDINSELLGDCGELNLGDPEVLEHFLKEGLAAYPAPKAALVMWDHGGGWVGMANDDDAPGSEKGVDEITLEEFAGVLSRSVASFPDGKLDLVHFDMCLMGQGETAIACAPFVRYMVGSAPVVPVVGMDYTGMLPLFARGLGTDKIASEMVKVGAAGFLKADNKDSSISAFDLSKADAFAAAFKALSARLAAAASENWGDVTRTLFYSLNYGGRSDYEREKNSLSSIDLLDWLFRMKKTLKTPPLQEIDGLEKATAALMLATEKGPQLPFCNGLSLYAPLRDANMRSDYARTEFSKKTGWADALGKIYAAQQKGGAEAPKVASLEIGSISPKPGVTEIKSGADVTVAPADEAVPLSASLQGGTYVKMTLEGKNILWAYAAFGIADKGNPENGDCLILMHTLLLDENLSQEETERKKEEAADAATALTPTFKDGRNELLYQFGGLMHRFSNGEEASLITADFMDVSDMGHFTVRGTYADSQTEGKEIPVEVVVNTEFYDIERMIATLSEPGKPPVMFLLKPEPEGVFRPILTVRTKEGVAKELPGEPLKWKKGLSVVLEMIPEGEFVKVMGMGESIGGLSSAFLSKPIRVKTNPMLAPYLDATRLKGAERLLGRYAAASRVPRSDGKGEILAPNGNVVEMRQGALPSGGEGLQLLRKPFEGEGRTDFLTWEQQGLPFFSVYTYGPGGYVLIERAFCVLLSDGGSDTPWRLLDAYDGSLTELYPLAGSWTSPERLFGAWKGEDGSRLEFENGRGSFEGGSERLSGTCTFEDNKLTIADGTGNRVPLAFICDARSDIMVVTFMNEGTAMVYRREAAVPQPPTHQPPVPQPPIPQPPQPSMSLDGYWGAAANGQQYVMQIQGNQYQAWQNGALFEAGVFQIQGNQMYGQTSMGQQFMNYFQMSPDGMSFSITNPNGFTMVYQRMR